MFQDYLKALSLILIAEMGDKTQIIALTFATMYKMRDILLGVTLGAGLNHAIAIVLGVMLTQFISLDFLQLVAGTVFIIFAIMSISSEEEEEDEESKKKLSPIMTVALAFFIGELGDKTQISALTLSLDSKYPLFILLGTTSGMVLTSLLGIIIGGKLGKKIPEFQLKVGAFFVFLGFGVEKLINSKYREGLNQSIFTLLIVSLGLFSMYKLYKFYIFSKGEEHTLLKDKAQELYEFKNKISQKIEELCIGDENCQSCLGEKCIVNFMKEAINKSLVDNSKLHQDELNKIDYLVKHNLHDIELSKEILNLIEEYVEKFPEEKGENYLVGIIKSLEKIIKE